MHRFLTNVTLVLSFSLLDILATINPVYFPTCKISLLCFLLFADTFQCLITVLVHEQLQSPVVTAALTSRLLGSLQNFFQYRKVVAPTFPYVLFQVDSHRVALQRSASLKKSSASLNQGDTRFLHHVRSFLEKRPSIDPKSSLSKEDRQKTEDILRPQTYNFVDGEVNADLPEADTPLTSVSSLPTTTTTSTTGLTTTSNASSASSSVGAKPSKEEKNKDDKPTEEKENSANTDSDNSKIYEHTSPMIRSVSCYDASCNIPTNFPQSKGQFLFFFPPPMYISLMVTNEQFCLLWIFFF